VKATDTSSDGESGAAHSLQYLESAGFSVLHSGQRVAIPSPLESKKDYQLITKESTDSPEKRRLELRIRPYFVLVRYWKFQYNKHGKNHNQIMSILCPN
jgi:hypothetical protein